MRFRDIYRAISGEIKEKMSVHAQNVDQFIDSLEKQPSFKKICKMIGKTIGKRTDEDFQKIVDYFKSDQKQCNYKLMKMHEKLQGQLKSAEKYFDEYVILFGSSKYMKKQVSPKKNNQDNTGLDIQLIKEDKQDKQEIKSRRDSDFSIKSSKKLIIRKLSQLSCEIKKQPKQMNEAGQIVIHYQRNVEISLPNQQQQIEIQPITVLAQEQVQMIEVKEQQQQIIQQISPYEHTQQITNIEYQCKQNKKLQVIEPLQNQQNTKKVQQECQEVVITTQFVSPTKQNSIDDQQSNKKVIILNASERSERLNNLYRRSEKMRSKFIKLSPMILSPTRQQTHYSSLSASHQEINTTEWQQQSIQSSYISQTNHPIFNKVKETQNSSTIASSSLKQSLKYPLPYNIDMASQYSSQVTQPK